MTQAFPRYCPRCGTPTREKMRLCPTCGLPLTAMLRRPRKAQARSNENNETQATRPEPAHVVPSPKQMQHESQPSRSPMPLAQALPVTSDPQRSPMSSDPQRSPLPPCRPASAEPVRSSLPPPSYPAPSSSQNVLEQQPGQPGIQAERGATSYAPIQPQLSMQAPVDPPVEAIRGRQHLKRKASRVAPSGTERASSAQDKRRAAIVLILLALLLMLGAGSYLVSTVLNRQFPRLDTSQAPPRTMKLHIPITYAGISITLLNVQQAQNFADDPHSADSGMLRLHLQERNTTTTSITWNYADSTRLLVRGRSAAAPVYVQSRGKIAPGVTQNSVLDFAVPNSVALSAIKLQLGAEDEAQMRIPLIAQANLSRYQAQAHQQHENTAYFGLSWILTSSTTSLSIPGQQATSGMEYLTLGLTVNNPLSQQVISGSPFDYARVKIGNKIFTPVSTTLLVSFTSGATSKTGAVTFLIPQNSASGTFLLLSQDSGASGQASMDFLLAQNSGEVGKSQ